MFDSVLSQNYPQLRHIVSYDTDQTYQYVKDYPHISQLIDLRQKRGQTHPNLYIDFFYDQIKGQPTGWVLVLDDDDRFMTPHALHYLTQFMKSPDQLIIWMLYRSDKFIYPKDKNQPVVGEIGTCCYLYHTSMIQKNNWGH